jgi:hypothetical protein
LLGGIFALVPALCFAQCPARQEALFDCKTAERATLALCASPGLLRTDAVANTTLDPKGSLQFRLALNGKLIVVPAHTSDSPLAFDADRGSAKASGAWWANLSARDGAQSIAVYVGVSDTAEEELNVLVHSGPQTRVTRYTCTNLSTQTGKGKPTVPDTYYRIVGALAQR